MHLVYEIKIKTKIAVQIKLCTYVVYFNPIL